MKRFATKAIGRVWRAAWRMAFALMAAGITWAAPIAVEAQGQSAILLDVSGPIGPATSEYIEQGLEKAASDMAAVVVLRMDTPGGLDTSMRAIIKAIISSPTPVATFVPSGGRAASAGTYILYASHIAAMAPGTNLGAATPVQIGGGQPVPIPDIDRFKDRVKENEKGKEAPAKAEKSPGMKEKIVNDAVAYIRSLAKMHGRNEDWAARAVTEAASLPAEEALKLGVIDVIAGNVEDLIAKIDGRTVMVRGKAQVVQSAGTALQPHAPDWRIEFLSIITNPNVAYILLLIGLYGLIFEFYNPGLIVPGVIGGISLLLGLYALQLLPINYAGLALSLLGIALIVAETFAPSFGALGIGGIAAFVIGSIILLDTDTPGYGVSWPLVAALSGVSGGIMLLTVLLLARSRRRAVVSGPEEMIGSTGTVVDWSENTGMVRVHGEIWRAQADQTLDPGRLVKVTEIDGLTLTVEPEASRR
jgi:membrane-bound serine protease (ClpP class)